MTFLLPQQTIFYQIEKALKRYRKLAQKTIDRAGYGVSINQVILLMNLKERPSANQAELAELIFKDFASVTRMIDLMVKKGFVSRIESKEDRRKKDLILTDLGNEMLENITPLIQEYRMIALDGFNPDEINSAFDFLKRITHNCEESTIKKTVES